MTDVRVNMSAMQGHGHLPGVVSRSIVIGLVAFLTVVDLFATQAIFPSLTRHYGVTPAAMGFAVNARTMGMAIAGLVVGFFQSADRSQVGHPREPYPACRPDTPTRDGSQSHRLHSTSPGPGTVHGVGVHAGLTSIASQTSRQRRVSRIFGRRRPCG